MTDNAGKKHYTLVLTQRNREGTEHAKFFYINCLNVFNVLIFINFYFFSVCFAPSLFLCV